MRAAIFNAQSLLGGELRKGLADSGLPLLDVVLVGGDSDDGTLCEYDGEPRVIHAWNVAAADGIDVMFRCDPGDGDPVGETADVPLVVDMGFASPAKRARLWQRHDAAGTDHGHYYLPHPIAGLLARVVQPLAAISALDGIQVIALEPISSHGNSGVDELHAQTVEALSFRPPPTSILGARLAFDVIAPTDDDVDHRIATELAVLVGSDVNITLTRLRVPVFFGLGLHVELGFSRQVDPADVATALTDRDGVSVSELPLSPGDLPSDDDNVDRVHVVVRESQPTNRLRLWAVADYLRAGLVRDALALVTQWSSTRS